MIIERPPGRPQARSATLLHWKPELGQYVTDPTNPSTYVPSSGVISQSSNKDVSVATAAASPAPCGPNYMKLLLTISSQTPGNTPQAAIEPSGPKYSSPTPKRKRGNEEDASGETPEKRRRSQEEAEVTADHGGVQACVFAEMVTQ